MAQRHQSLVCSAGMCSICMHYGQRTRGVEREREREPETERRGERQAERVRETTDNGGKLEEQTKKKNDSKRETDRCLLQVLLHHVHHVFKSGRLFRLLLLLNFKLLLELCIPERKRGKKSANQPPWLKKSSNAWHVSKRQSCPQLIDGQARERERERERR